MYVEEGRCLHTPVDLNIALNSTFNVALNINTKQNQLLIIRAEKKKTSSYGLLILPPDNLPPLLPIFPELQHSPLPPAISFHRAPFSARCPEETQASLSPTASDKPPVHSKRVKRIHPLPLHPLRRPAGQNWRRRSRHYPPHRNRSRMANYTYSIHFIPAAIPPPLKGSPAKTPC